MDPTGAQFADRSMKAFSAEHMLSTPEGAALAATLLREGGLFKRVRFIEI